jgi:DNA modification methylase
LIWNKPKGTLALNANYKPCFELFYYIKIQGNRNWSGNNAEWTVWDIEYKKDNTLHPTQKPIGLIEKAIKNHTAKSILDFFLGSGSTMVASHQLKRKCYGMELDPKYCDVIVKRMIKLDDTLTIKLNGVDVTKDWK